MNVLETLLADRRPANGSYLTIAVDGRCGAGKSSFAAFLADHLPGFAVLNGDDYFKPHDDDVTWGAFNDARLDAEVLSSLRAGDPVIESRAYDFPRGVVGPVRRTTVERGVVLERWLSMGLPVDWDLTIWVESPADVCLDRGLARAGGVALGERARRAWTEAWQPQEARYIEEIDPLRAADLVIDGTRSFDAQTGPWESTVRPAARSSGAPPAE